MSSRSMSPPPIADDSDLESTAELPVLDPAGNFADGDHSSTDTWAALPPLRHEHDLPADATLEGVSVELRAAHMRLTTQAERLSQLERDREHMRAARTAAETLATTLSAELARLEGDLAARATELSELAQARGQAERRADELGTQLSQLQSGGDAEAARELTAQRAAAEQRATVLDAELARLQAAASQHASQFADLTQARTAGELRISRLDGELAGVRGELAAASQRGTELQQRLDAHEKAAQVARAQQLKDDQGRAERDRQHAAHSAAIMADLHSERARAMSYYESAQTLAGGRSLFEALVTDQYEEAEAREQELARTKGTLADREARLAKQATELAERAARIAALEKQVSASGSGLAERDTQLRDARRETQGLQTSMARLQEQLAAGAERVRALQAAAALSTSTESQRKSELSRLLAERVDLTAAVEAARAAATTVSTQQGVHEQASAQYRTREGELSAAVATERKRADGLDEELSTLRREMEDWAGTVKAAHHERTTLEAAQARVKELERRELERSLELAREDRQATGASAERVAALEADLTAAEEAVNRLEGEARTREARLAELEKAGESLRMSLEQASQAATMVAIPALPGGAHRMDEAEHIISPAPDGATRLLIRNDAGREVVYVLGRKTSVGRTPDNDLQIDAKFISRHHAVILAGPVQTIIEDLNSTNGVQVNGRRVTRQALLDGDAVSIGRQQYRFAVRKSNEKR